MSSIAVQRSSPAIRTSAARAGGGEPLEAVVDVGAGTVRGSTCATVRGPSSRSRSATPSTSLAWRSVGEPLQLGLDLGEHLGVEQLAQLGAAEQLGQQALVEAQRGGAALGDG